MGHTQPLLQLARKLKDVHHVTFAVFDSMLPYIERELITHDQTGDRSVALLRIPKVEFHLPGAENIQLKHAITAMFEDTFPVMRELFRSFTEASTSTVAQEYFHSNEPTKKYVPDIVIVDIFLGMI